MTKDRIRRAIGAMFGLVFIEVNAGALPSPARVSLRALAFAGFVGLLVVLRRGAAQPTGSAPSTDFGRRYRFVVAVEVVVGLAGIGVVNGPLHSPHATVAWIALVVGLHFFGLAAVWRLAPLRWLGAAMSVCGAAGLALAAYGSAPMAIAAWGHPGGSASRVGVVGHLRHGGAPCALGWVGVALRGSRPRRVVRGLL